MVTIDNFKDDMWIMASLFDSTFNSLITVYARCSTKESWKDEPNREQIKVWNNRSLQIAEIKNKIPKMDVTALYQAVQQYSPELRQMLDFEDSQDDGEIPQ